MLPHSAQCRPKLGRWQLLALAATLTPAAAFFPYDAPAPPVRTASLPIYKSATAKTSALSSQNSIYNIHRASGTGNPSGAGIHQDGTDFSYFVSVRFADTSEDGPEFNLLIDTASSRTWVMGADCPTTGPCGIHNTFDPDAANEVKPGSVTALEGEDFSIGYGSGSVSGSFVRTAMSIASFRVDDYPVGVADEVSDDFNSFPMDGILGLSRGSATEESANGRQVLDFLVEQGHIGERVFAVRLWRAADGGENIGVLDLGAPDRQNYKGDLVYQQTVQVKGGDNFWALPVGQVFVGKSAVNAIPNKGRTAILDTGTSLIFMPIPDARAIHAAIPGAELDPKQAGDVQNRYKVSCSSRDTVGFSFNGVQYDLKPADWVGLPVEDDEGKCYTNIVGRDIVGEGVWLVGDVFLKNVYSVFDQERGRIGLARVADSSGGSDDDKDNDKDNETKPTDKITNGKGDDGEDDGSEVEKGDGKNGDGDRDSDGGGESGTGRRGPSWTGLAALPLVAAVIGTIW